MNYRELSIKIEDLKDEEYYIKAISIKDEIEKSAYNNIISFKEYNELSNRLYDKLSFKYKKDN